MITHKKWPLVSYRHIGLYRGFWLIDFPRTLRKQWVFRWTLNRLFNGFEWANFVNGMKQLGIFCPVQTHYKYFECIRLFLTVYQVKFCFVDLISVTNITFTGSAMVSWNSRLLIQGVTTVIVVNVHALGHFVGWSASIKGSRSPRHRKQTRLGWVVEILVYLDEGRHSYRWVLGSATDWTPFVHNGLAVAGHTWMLWCTV